MNPEIFNLNSIPGASDASGNTLPARALVSLSVHSTWPDIQSLSGRSRGKKKNSSCFLRKIVIYQRGVTFLSILGAVLFYLGIL